MRDTGNVHHRRSSMWHVFILQYPEQISPIAMPSSGFSSSSLIVRGTEEEVPGSRDCSFLEYIIRDEHGNERCVLCDVC
jgi:hypothetical protein